MRFGPALRGPLVISRAGSGWRAAIGGAEAPATLAGGELRADFGGRGSFRGRLEQGGRLLRGFWLQPSGATADRRDPGGAGQAFATPMLLHRGGTVHEPWKLKGGTPRDYPRPIVDHDEERKEALARYNRIREHTTERRRRP